MITVDAADVEAWYRVPADDIGYLDSRELLTWPDQRLKDLVNQVMINRYTGWRNHDGLWMSQLLQMRRRWGLTMAAEPTSRRLEGADVLDYGCGLGIEAMMYARAGATVSLADISKENVLLAERVIRLHEGGRAPGAWVIGQFDPLPHYRARFDVIHCAGVLHHIRDPRPTVELWRELIRPDGEVRLMVYSDIGWQIATGTDVSADDDPELRQRFIRTFDEVGSWADWYDETKLIWLCRNLFQVTRFRYITEDDRYAVAILEPR